MIISRISLALGFLVLAAVVALAAPPPGADPAAAWGAGSRA